MIENENLRAWIKQNYRTMTEFARAMGYSRKQISLITNKHRPVTDEFIGRFIRRFGIDTISKIISPSGTADQALVKCI